MAESEKPPSLEDLEARLRAARGAAERDAGDGGPEARRRQSAGLGLAWRISVELVAAVAVGGGIGYALDDWLGTLPLFMVVLLLLGGAAGVMNVYRVVRGYDDSVGFGAAARRQEQDAGAQEAKSGGDRDERQPDRRSE